MIEERGFQLAYPPAYSADLNPSEEALSQIKGLGVRPKPELLRRPWSR
jgi:transposase